MLQYLFYSQEYCHLCLETKSETFICQDCQERLVYVNGDRELEYGECFYPLFYNNFIKSKIKQFKYKSDTYLVKPFVEILYNFVNQSNLKFDYISFIPMYIKDEYKRGYNQSYLLAKYLAKALDKPIIDILSKSKATKHQNKLDRKERLHNLENAFQIKRLEGLNSKTILLVDDLVTTGSTLNVVSKLILENYDLNLIYLVLASSKVEGEVD